MQPRRQHIVLWFIYLSRTMLEPWFKHGAIFGFTAVFRKNNNSDYSKTVVAEPWFDRGLTMVFWDTRSIIWP